jgi:hypothetical protein
MQNSTITLIVAVAGIAGTPGGVIVGQTMTRDAQHK